MLRFLVVPVLACVVAVGVQPASAATKRACPKRLAEGGAIIPGESWFVKGTSCANGKRVIKKYNQLAGEHVSEPKPYGYRCAPVHGSPEMMYCKKGKRRVDFWPAVHSDSNG
jgi:hypothetical protein